MRPLLITTIVLAGLTATLSAQPLTVGSSIEGSLSASDPVSDLGAHEASVSLSVEEGQSTIVDLMSDSFDTYLRVTLPGGVVVENDDAGRGTGSRVVFTPSESGEATVTVTTFSAGVTGDYTLSASLNQDVTLAIGAPVSGHSEPMQGPESFLLDLTEGGTLRLRMEHGGEVGYLMLILPGGREMSAMNMEGGDVEMFVSASEDGAARLMAAAGSMSGAGADYTISVESFEPDSDLAFVGEPLDHAGTLGSGSSATVLLRAEPGQRVQVDLMSEEFDTVLTAAGLDEPRSNDDGGEGTNSRLTLRMPRSGQVILVAEGFSDLDSGSFQMHLTDPGPLMAPAFTLSDLDGALVSSDTWDGQIRIIDFWATWCPPCVEEMPHFIEIAEEYADRGVVVVGISTDDSPSVVRPFIEERQVTYPILMDNGRVSEAYGALTDEGVMEGVPTTFVIDRSGEVVAIFVAYRDKAVFVREIEALLASDD